MGTAKCADAPSNRDTGCRSLDHYDSLRRTNHADCLPVDSLLRKLVHPSFGTDLLRVHVLRPQCWRDRRPRSRVGELQSDFLSAECCARWCVFAVFAEIIPAAHSLSTAMNRDGFIILIYHFRTQWVRNLSYWRYFANYFPVVIHKTVDLPADKNYMMGLFPHGLLRYETYYATLLRATLANSLPVIHHVDLL